MSAEPGLGDERLDLGDVLNTVLDKGLVLRGGVMLGVADVDLVRLDLGLLLSAVESELERSRKAPLLASALGPPDFSGGRSRRAHAGERGEETPDTVEPLRGIGRAAGATLEEIAPALPERIDADPGATENGLARLVLTLIELLRKVLEHQAIRRMEGGTLSDAEVERIGIAMLRLHDRMKEMKETFGLTDDDLQIDLGPLGHLR